MSSSSGAADVSISALLKKTEHYDKDERYMATSDLCEVLKRQQGQDAGGGGGGGGGNTMDSNTERQICTAVLRLLHDKSNDVQAIAVKTLGVLLTTVKQEQVLEIADSLADQVLDASKSELRDVYAIGLRTLVKTIPPSMGNRVSQRLVGRLLDGIRTCQSEIVLACCDCLTDLLTRFGATALTVTRQHEPILQVCLTQLASPHAVVRKRAGTTLGCLSVVLSDALLMRMVEALLSQIDMAQNNKTPAAAAASADGQTQQGDTRALIRTMCTVSGAVGHRLGQEQIDRILPIFLRFTNPEDAITGDDEGGGASAGADATMEEHDEAAVALANELRESCFMGFESFVLRCPKEVEPHLEKIIQAALSYMSFDPNYSYGDDDEQQDEEEDEYEDEDDEYDEEDDEDDDDDDDESWKVRRSAIRALRAVVEAKRADPLCLWKVAYSTRLSQTTTVAAALVGRFKEREENCRVGVMDCFTRLLSVTITAADSQTGVVTFADGNSMDDDKSIDMVNDYAPKLVKACEKILSTKKGNERSKSSALALLATLCQAPGGVGKQAEIGSVFRHVKTFLASTNGAQKSEFMSSQGGTSKTLRLDALALIHAMLVSDKHDPAHVRANLVEALLPELCQAVQEQWYKVIAQGLRALAAVPRFFASDESPEERQKVATMLYEAMEPLLAAHDVDQEIKECALQASAALLSCLHASMPPASVDRMLKLLLERLKNETTRIAAIKTLSTIAASGKDENAMDDDDSKKLIDLTPILSDSISVMASFLKLQSRSLKQSSLEALDVVVQNHGKSADYSQLYATVLQELASLIDDSDLHISHLSLRATVSVLQVCPGAGPAVKTHLLDHALKLSTSALVQDVALDSLLAFFKQLVASQAVEFQELLTSFRQRLSGEAVSKHGVYNLAKCIAVITATTDRENTLQVVNQVFEKLSSAGTSPDKEAVPEVQLSLLITGDLGRMVDLASFDGVAERLKTLYISYFDSPHEDLRQAAAYALGNASVGSQATFLPAICTKLDEDNKKQQYLLLSALREFIQSSFRVGGTDGVAASLPVVLPPLERHCSDEEEGVRTMVAECMGSLTCLQPETLLTKLSELLKGHSEIAVTAERGVPGGDAKSAKNALVCWTVATSVKLAIAGKVDSTQLSPFMPTFVKLLDVTELSVRLAALLMVYSAVHHEPQVVATLLKDSVMPALYQVSDLKLERKVDLGPFTHKVDDALPLRKAALSIFATCLDSLPSSMDITEFMPVLAKALGDAEDIQLHAHQIITWMAAPGRQGTYLVASIDSFCEPLEKTINKKPGQKQGTELERLNDWIKSALRATLALAKCNGAMNSRTFAELVGRVKANTKFTSMLEALGEES